MLIPYTIFIMIYVKYNFDSEQYKYDSFDALFAYTNIHHNYNNIIYLDCSYNKLTKLFTLLPSLKTGNCTQRVLPTGLQTLHCDNNQLNELPTLPDSLQMIWCFNNQLNELPTLPTSLQGLYCYNNLLNELPTLPNSLQTLICDNNPNLEYTNEYLEENKKFENTIKECGKLYEPLIKGISL
jgi:hypothetical protein